MKRLTFIFISLLFLLSCSEDKIIKNEKKINPLYDLAYQYRQSGKSKSAFLYFDKAKNLFLQEKDSLGVGKCLVNMAIISTNNGDYFGGQEISLSAISYFNETDKNHLEYIKSNLNNLGISFYNLKDYDRAISFYQQSLIYASDRTALVIKNNIANAYREKKKFRKSLEFYEYVLKHRGSDSTEYARALTNISITKWLQDPNYDAVPNLLKALHIREEKKDLEDLSASYAHLSDYYFQKRPDVALIYALKMYSTAKNTSNAEDRLLALQKLVKLSHEKEAKRYFEIYQNLSDSVTDARNVAKNQFAFIRYESEKNKADNLNLQKDNTEKKYQIIKRELLLYSTILLLIVSTIVATFWYKKRRLRLELESENAIRASQLKTSRKVHDVVANGLYRIMTKLDNQETLKNDPIVDEIEELYEKSRDISYEETQFDELHFHEKLSRLLKSFATATTKILIVGNEANLWEKISPPIKYELEHVLQELMVNMKKHSQANDVLLKFEQVADQVNISYSDNGIGMAEATPFNNGLTSTGNRINSINGMLTFESNNGKGLKIKITFPLA